MRPSEKFAKVMEITCLCAAICGANVFVVNYKINRVTFLVVFCISLYFVLSVYTFNLKFSENLSVALESFCVVGGVLQGITKLCSWIYYSKDFYEEYMFITAIYAEFEAKGDDYVHVLNKCIRRIQFTFRSMAIMYTTGTLIWISVPIIIWAFTGHRTFVIQFYLPYLDADTDYGYFGTIAMQSMCLIFGVFGSFAGDTTMMNFFGHSSLLVDIFELKAKEFNELALKFKGKQVDEKLAELIKWHQMYSNFIENIDRMYLWINFTQITTSGLSIVLTLVIIFTSFWPGSYVYLVVLFLVMYLYCGMGTIVESANEKLEENIYAIHWYLLTVSQQKAIRFMLMRSQTERQIRIGGVVPLSVSTGLQVTKTIYSIFMMLLNFFQ